jgi:hypothetical protein
MKLINNTKSTSRIGTVVKVDPRDPKSFILANTDDTKVLGIVAESKPYRELCDIISYGVAQVYVQGNVRRGDVIRYRKSTDGISAGNCAVAKTGDEPYLQVGTALESGRGLVKTELSFQYIGSTSSTETDPVAMEALASMGDPTGFENRTDSAWTFTDGTKKLAITTVGGYDIWFAGVKHTITTAKEITIADTEGTHLIYFDTDDTLKEEVNPSTATIVTLIETKCLVAYVYWDATNNVGVYVGEERHGMNYPGAVHVNMHFTRGLQFLSGLGLGDFVIGNGSLNSHAQFSIEGGAVADEDIYLPVSAINATTGVPVLYRDGANGYWRTVTQAGFSCYQNPAGATKRLMWNEFTGVVWQLTEMTEGDYMLYHIFATTGKVKQMYSIMGQARYTTTGNARAGAATEVSALLLGALPSPEIRPIATVIFQTDKDYGNTINARVIEVDPGVENYIDWRTNDLPRGTAPSDHGSLSGLTDLDHPQYLNDEFETVSKNLRNYPYALVYGIDGVSTITYDLGGGLSIVKTFNYVLGVLTTIVLSGDTPSGIELTKTLSYTGADLTSVAYS